MVFNSNNRLLTASKTKFRRIPEIYYYIDDTLDEMYKVDSLLDNLK